MRRENREESGWKNIVSMGSAGFWSGASNVAKRFMTKREATRASKESSTHLLLLVAFVVLVIGIPLLIGALLAQ